MEDNNEFYKIVADENEMKWFFDHILEPPEVFETYMVCLSARGKKIPLEEREIYQLGRGEMMRTELIRRKGGNWNFDIYKQAPYKYNCHKSAMLTKSGLPYPEKCLVCYAYVNPSDELDCVDDTVVFYDKIKSELVRSYRKNSKDGVDDHLEKLPKIFEHLRSCHASHLSRRIWRDFDFDVDVPKEMQDKLSKDAAKIFVKIAIIEHANKFYGKGNYAIVDTSGGYHLLVKVSAMKSNPNNFIAEVQCTQFEHNDGALKGRVGDLCKEVKLTEVGSQFLPMPGTLQYGRLVTIINKEDFE
jgi:hypothetical protein